MHYDQKVGLALAVLLIGATGAFFFRNDPLPTAELPELKHAADLDATIGSRPNGPYLAARRTARPANPAIKAVDFPGRPGSGSASAGPHRVTVDGGPDPFADEDDVDSQAGLGTKSDVAAVPVPMPDATGTLDDGRAANPGVATTSATNVLPANDRTHTVQKGETLSSIAAKYLDRDSRFQEIYELNRNQLSDANDLKVGMVLRIPARTNVPSVKTPEEPVSGAAGPSARPRPPNVDQREQARKWAGKRLSQLPPKE